MRRSRSAYVRKFIHPFRYVPLRNNSVTEKFAFSVRGFPYPYIAFYIGYEPNCSLSASDTAARLVTTERTRCQSLLIWRITNVIASRDS